MTEKFTNAIAADITRAIMAGDHPIEDGWSMVTLMQPIAGLSPEHLAIARVAFFLGAQHILGSLSTMLEEEEGEAVEQEIRMIDRVARELNEFVETYKKLYG